MMNRSTMNLVKGIVAGVAVGAAVGLISSKPIKHNKGSMIRKNTGKALRAMGNFIDNVSYMIK